MIKSLLVRLLIELVFVHVAGGLVFCIDKLFPDGTSGTIDTIPHFYAYAIAFSLAGDGLYYLFMNEWGAAEWGTVLACAWMTSLGPLVCLGFVAMVQGKGCLQMPSAPTS